MQEIKLIENLKIGHDSVRGKTGCTVFLAPHGTKGGVCVRGAAPASRETDLLRAENAVSQIDAIVLSGGSAFGLASADGVMKYLAEQKRGFAAGDVKVPLVAGACIFDLNKTVEFPNAINGYNACKNASNKNLRWGKVGAGIGATVGKILGRKASSSGGIGFSTITAGNAFVTAITVVNALGDVIDIENGGIVAGANDGNGNFLNSEKLILGHAHKANLGSNTTLSVVQTNVELTKLELNKLASVAHNGFAKAISPVHTDYDGDTIFTLSFGKEKLDFTALSVMAVEAVRRSIINSVT